MSINLNDLSNVATGINALSNLIAVTPYSYGINATQQTSAFLDGSFTTSKISPPTFLFDYEGEQTVTLESDITDHYIEDNTSIQDQIALKPEMITTHGFIGELNDIPPNTAFQIAKIVAEKLTVISAYTPALSAAALLAYNEAFYAYQIASNALAAAQSLGNLLSGTAQNQTKQAKAFQKFYGYWANRTLFQVITPWGSFANMAIKTLRAVQDPDTKVITNFEVTFKKMKFASTTATIGVTNTSGQLTSQDSASSPVDLGSNQPPLSDFPQSSLIAGLA